MLIRRAERGDAEAVARLVDEHAARDFFYGAKGDNDMRAPAVAESVASDLVLKSVLAVTVVGENGNIVAFASFDDTPLAFADTEEYLANEKRDGVLAGAGTSNTLFLTSLVAHPDFETASSALEQVLRTLFETLPETDFVTTLTGNDSSVLALLEGQGFTQTGLRIEDGRVGSALLRPQFRPNLETRDAQVEDYDNLVKIFDMQSKILTETYGEYFLAELIENQDEHNRAVVADLDGKAVGLMCVSSEIDHTLLLSCFQLESFGNFCKVGAAESKEDERGELNVFAVTLFCLDELHGSRTCDLLESAFECFPDKEYCALTLPNDVYEPLLLPYFFRVPIRDEASLSHSLYAIHRDSLRGLRASYRAPPAAAVYELDGDKDVEAKLTEWDAISSPAWVRGSQLLLEHATIENLDSITELVDGVETADKLIEAVTDSFKLSFSSKDKLNTLVVKILNQTIGVLIVETSVSPDAAADKVRVLDHLFDLRSVPGVPEEGPARCGMQHGVLKHIVLVPIFAQFSRAILRDAMRILELHAMHYKLYPGDRVPSAVVENLAQVRPRRVQHLQRVHRRRHLTEPRNRHSRFALFSICKSSLSKPRLTVNTRVVVVGASETGLAALEELLLAPHIHFSSLTLVTPGGVPDECVEGVRTLCTQGTSVSGGYDSRFLDRLGLRDRITILDDRMVCLEREVQAVVLADGSLLEYDYLMLASGLQDTTLQTTCGLREEDFKECKPLADSVYAVNSDPIRAATMQLLVRGKHAASKEQCVIYGASLEAFSVAQVMLESGKLGKYITMVHPGTSAEWMQGCFDNDDWVCAKVADVLISAGVNIKHGLKFAGIERVHEHGRISKAVFIPSGAADDGNASDPTMKTNFTSRVSGGIVTATVKACELQQDFIETNPESLHGYFETYLAKDDRTQGNNPKRSKDIFQEIPCGLLICATRKNIDQDIFTSINDSGLVYDGRAVVDAEFRTVDPRIFAAGTNTKFSRKYHIKHAIEHFNSREVGSAAAASLLSVVDPLRKTEYGIEAAKKNSSSPARFGMPKVNAQSLELPGSVRYFRASRIGWNPRVDLCKALETASKDAFCKLQIDRFGIVAAVSYGLTDGYVLKKTNDNDGHEEHDGKQKEEKSEYDSSSSDNKVILSKKEKATALSKKNRLAPLDQLVGVHVSYLNDLENQLAIGEIHDLFEFLSRDWAAALYHDRFGDFCRMLKFYLEKSTAQDEDLSTVIKELKEEYASSDSQDLNILTKRNKLIGACGGNLKGNAKRSIQASLVSFLKENATILEMYCLGK